MIQLELLGGKIMKVHKIILPTPYQVGDVNAYLLKGDTLSIFDVGTKTEETFEALKKGIEQAGYSMNDIEQVVLTHHHPDHAGWVDAFPKAEIIGHRYVDFFLRRDAEFLKYRKQFLRKHLILAGVPKAVVDEIDTNTKENNLIGTYPLTKFLNDGDEVPGHPGLIAHYTPGHAESHFIFVHEQSKTAITGDLLLEKISPNPLVEPPIDYSMNRPKYFVKHHESLKLLKTFHLEKIYTGHGKDLENVNELVDLQLKKDHERAMQVLQLIDEPKTLLDITKQLYASAYQKVLSLTLSKTLGFLDYLENEGYITAEQEGDIIFYRKI